MNNLLRHSKFALIPNGPILDIGSGSNPFWRANILLERYLSDGSQRPGRLIIDRPIVCGDITDIPFLDRSFVFLHCSHVLEHVEDPEKAIQEIMRVAQSGYIETPSEIHEYIDLNKPYHRWAISIESGVLVFREKDTFQDSHPLVDALRRPANRTAKIIRRSHDRINLIKIFWHKHIDIIVERSDNPIQGFRMNNDFGTIEGDQEDFVVRISKMKIKRMLNKLYPYKLQLDTMLACPICKHRINITKNGIACKNCNIEFPIINGIPIMLKDAARKF